MSKRTHSKTTGEPVDVSKPLRLAAHEAFAQHVAKGASQSESYRKIYPKSRRWKETAVHVKASELTGKVSGRIAWLKSQAADDTIMDITERKRILTEIARGNVADYVEGGKDGTWVSFGPESKNTRAVRSLKARTTEDGAVITELSVRDPEGAIDLLNKMDGVYVEKRELTGKDGKDLGPLVVVIDGTEKKAL